MAQKAEEKKESDASDAKESQTKQQMEKMVEIMTDLIAETKALKKELKEYRKDEIKESLDKASESFDIDKLISTLLTGNDLERDTKIKLNENDLLVLCEKAKQLFLSQPMLLPLSFKENNKFIIAGPTNGNFYDLLNILKNGLPDSDKNINYLFLGNYVDRGLQSLETISLLYSLKIKYPNNIWLIRGNHECSAITRIYGFYDELKQLNMIKLYDEFIECFDSMPVAAIIDNKILSVCGGISPQLNTFKDIECIERPIEIPKKGMLTDLLWSDPVDDDIDDYQDSKRGAGCHFGPKQVANFCEKFKIELIIRGLAVHKDGYSKTKDGKVITVFSVPDYCGTMDNDGAIIKIDKQCNPEFVKLPRVKK